MHPDSRRHVLHLIESGGVYGAEKVILSLSREMQRAGDLIPVVGCIVQRRDENVELRRVASASGIATISVHVPNWLAPFALPMVAWQLRKLGVGIIHCHGYKPSVYASLLGKLSGAKVMATCHLWYVEADAPLKMKLMVKLEKFLYRYFPAVVAVSEQIKAILASSGVQADKIQVIKNGIDLAPLPSRESAGAGGGPVRLLNVGRLTNQKAQWDVIAACAELHREAPELEFACRIAGEGELRPALEARIAREGLDGKVELLGYQENIDALLREADIFLLPSISEGMPVSLLEAVAAGVPVVATAVGDVPRLIEDGISGIVVKVHDVRGLVSAIARLAGNKDLCLRLATEARRKLEREYSSHGMYQQYEAIYHRLLHLPRRLASTDR